MRLAARGTEFSPRLAREIESLTSQAVVLVDTINRQGDTAELVLERHPVAGFRRPRWLLPPRRAAETVRTAVCIRNVLTFSLRNNDESLTRPHALLGIGVRPNEVFISSAEEDRGKTVFLMRVGVSELDIVLEDLDMPRSPQ